MQNKTRTFIAIDPPDEIIKEVKRLQSHLSQIKFTGKLTELENLHLTLKFLGEIDKKTLSITKHKLSQLTFPEFQAKLSQCGTFSFKGQPRIVWLKITGQLIFKLQNEIDEILKPRFRPEHRFMSHLTISRIKHVKDIPSFNNLIKTLKPKPIQFPVTNIKLKSSELTPFGPKYKTLKSYKLIKT